ncbi:hypothetical protein [Jannaschia sp. CCS1]|uniref:hypothetical protein n=1 Tax=Jannaschia sp. (strain CCS1) TaxID=290400 RepID=UPI000053AE78|nr:hypothetical protein [Jannaschia sp. CCS1]ABD56356.1 hypothetical protein Jann_3439 [Jannaschia sp. CCS1]
MARKKKIDPDEHLASIIPRAPRRVVAVGFIVSLAVIVWTVAALRPPEHFGYMLFLVFFGAGCFWLGYTMWHASAREIELTRSELREVGGRVLCTVDNVARVDRGAFAFKPAGGFLIRLKEPHAPRVYAPGLWWRWGRTLAVGGVTARQDGKNVADMMIVMLVERGEDV